MIFSNINNLSITLFLLFVWISFIFAYFLFKKQKNIRLVICLWVSILFLSVNIFQIKWWISKSTESINGSNILFVLDVSKSMDTQDILLKINNTSRLIAAKSFINTYLDEYINNKYWLFVFAWETLEILPFTSDIWLYKTILGWVDKNNTSKYWSEFLWIFKSLSYFFTENNSNSLVIIMTDWWEEDNIDLQEYIEKLNEKNIKVLIVWVGSLEWDYIPISKNRYNQIQYKIYNWKKVISKLNESFLKTVSLNHNFEYVHLKSLSNFSEIDNMIKKLSHEITFKKDIDSRSDLTYIFMYISFIFFILFLFFEYRLWKK